VPGERDICEVRGEGAKGTLGGSRGLISASMCRVDAVWEMVEWACDTDDSRLEWLSDEKKKG
jgi:hypothetical protein